MLATEIVIQCGSKCVDWDSFLPVLRHCSPSKLGDPNNFDPQYPKLHRGFRSTTFHKVMKTRRNFGAVAAPYILDLGIDHQDAICREIRDKDLVFSAWPSLCCRETIKVQYQSSPLDLHHQILEHSAFSHGIYDEIAFLWDSKELCECLGVFERGGSPPD